MTADGGSIRWGTPKYYEVCLEIIPKSPWGSDYSLCFVQVYQWMHKSPWVNLYEVVVTHDLDAGTPMTSETSKWGKKKHTPPDG